VVEALAAGRIDLAWLPPMLQPEAQKRRARILALPQRNGSVAFRSALLVKRESRLKQAVELLGQRAAWRNEQSASGYIFPRLELLRMGPPTTTPFASERFYGSVIAGAEAVVKGEADFCTVFITKAAAGNEAVRDAELFRTLGHLAAPLRVVHVTGLIPPDAFCVGGHVGPADEAALGQALFHVHTTASGADVLQALVQAEKLVPLQPVMLQSLRSWAAMLEERAAEMAQH
jgi:ABC-type phosphate/phosphonate transport system substrate-binding protein